MTDSPDELPLSGQVISLTGRFASMTQDEFADLIRKLGGQVAQSPHRKVTCLVTGQEGWPLGSDGQPTQNLLRVRRLQSEGFAIEILTEEAFLQRAGLVDHQSSIHRRYTLAQLSRILNVPRQQLRTWMRIGFIEPVEVTHRLAYFDYQQVTSARMLEQLMRNGLNASALRGGLERLKRWFPSIHQPLMQLAILETDGGILVRLGDGRLAETTGQLLLDFDASNSPSLTAIEDEPTCVRFREIETDTEDTTADDAFDLAVQFEEEGNFVAAAKSYELAIREEPNDPVFHFNLGNVAYLLGHLSRAEECFRTAATLDGLYVEAWNNLGSVLSERQDHEKACRAFERALQIVPHYADAHYNMAKTLSHLGRDEQAQYHASAYLRLDPRSSWSDELRAMLQAGDGACTVDP